MAKEEMRTMAKQAKLPEPNELAALHFELLQANAKAANSQKVLNWILSVGLAGCVAFFFALDNRLDTVEASIAALPQESPPAWFQERVDRLEARFDRLEQLIKGAAN